MSDSEDQPVEIELYEEIADERYSTPEGSRSSSPHQSPRQSRSKDPQNKYNVRSYSAARPEIKRASRSIRAAAGGSDNLMKFVIFAFLVVPPPYSFVSIFVTARCHASAVLAMALCPSVCPSITSRCFTKTAKRRITQTTTLDSIGTQVF